MKPAGFARDPIRERCRYEPPGHYLARRAGHRGFAPGGSITTGTETDALQWLFRDLLDRKTKKLVFDLAGIEEIDSSGTLFLVRCYFSARAAGGELRFAAAGPDVIRPFKRAKLDTELPFDPTVAVACEHLIGESKTGGGRSA